MAHIDLAIIFCPSFISHPQHEMSCNYKEHALSQNVLEFLIVEQDSFVIRKGPLDPTKLR